MKILITGGTGLIGRELTDALHLDGHQISVLTRNPQKAQDVFLSDIQILKWGGESSHGWGGIIDESDAIINLAGESIAGNSLFHILTRRWSKQQKSRIKQSRLKISAAVTEAIHSASKKPDIFIQSSAVGYYGPTGLEKITEGSPAGMDYLAQVCQAWEASTESIELLRIPRVIIRTGLVLSSKGGILPIMLLPFRFFIGGPIGRGNQYIPWIHIQDHVNAIRFLLSKENANGPYNLSAPNPVTNRDFGKITGQILQRPNKIPAPDFALKMALGEKSTLILDGQRAIPNRLLKAKFKFKYEFLDEALQDLITR